MVQIRPATAADYKQLIELLQAENLPVVDIDAELPHFFVAVEEKDIVAGIGLEHYGEAALLRSMVTAPGWRNRGLAATLIDQLIQYAASKSVQKVFAVATTAEKYLQAKGFTRIDRSLVHPMVLQSAEFNGLCPSTAAVLYREL
jgi:amino-acid N-acetyltransferase